MFLGLGLFISLFFPSSIHFEYNFEYGDQWRYEHLQAPFDFPILKTAEELQKEKNELSKNTPPYYRLHKQVLAEQKDSFMSRFRVSFQAEKLKNPNTHAKIDTHLYIRTGLGLLDYVYNKKLIHISEAHSQLGTAFVCELIDGDMSMGEYGQKDFISSDAAAELLLDSLYKLGSKIEYADLLTPVLNQCLAYPNITYDSILTNKTTQTNLLNLSKYRGMVKTGEVIITRNGIVDSLIYRKLSSLKQKHVEEVNQYKSKFLVYIGYLSLTIALLGIFYTFMHFYSPEVLYDNRHLGLILSLIGIFSYIAHIVHQLPFLNEYLIPFCIAPIIILNFFSSHLALFAHIVIILTASMLLSLDYQFILIQMIVGMVAIITKLKTRYLNDFFSSILYIGLIYTAGFVSLELIRTGAIFPIYDPNQNVLEQGVRWQMLTWIGLNMFLTLLSYPLVPIIERMFGLVSDITLIELSDLNRPLLKELSVKASGTLQHSLQVAHLAETAANEIGANALLVRVGALYHDIGKMSAPEYFIENQPYTNPHERISYLESAQKIIAHVSEGERLARLYKLPEVLIDFIRTHHGSTRVEYFYRMYQNDHPTEEVSPEMFQYKGPIPRNREEAILMIADSLEAASRSLKNPCAGDIEQLVENIIRGKISHGQFNQTNLSFKELESIKQVFKKVLKSIHHVRIEYPKQ